jgi:hypothetical protein
MRLWIKVLSLLTLALSAWVKWKIAAGALNCQSFSLAPVLALLLLPRDP